MNSVKKLFLNKLHTPVWLFLLITFIIILRIPTLFEPYWNNNEAMFLVIGKAINHGAMLYSEINAMHPPLIYHVAAISGNLFMFKAFLAIWHVITVYMFWRLSERLFPKKIGLQRISSFLFGLFSTFPLLQGNVASPEIFMLSPTMLAFYLLLNKNLSKNSLLLSGILLSISTMFWFYGFFGVFAIIFVWLTSARSGSKIFAKILRRFVVVLTGMIMPIFITMIYYWQNNALSEYVYFAYLQNFNQLFFLYSFVIISAHLLLYWAKKSLSRQFLFLSSWLFVTVFVFFTSPQHHGQFLLTALPPVALLVGVFFTSKKMDQPLSIVPLSVFFFIPFFFSITFHSTINYYSNFMHLALGSKTIEEHHTNFGNHVVRNYKISNYTKDNTKKQDTIYVQGENKHLVYALSNRVVSARSRSEEVFFVSNPSNQNNQLNKNPRLVVLLSPESGSSQLKDFLNNNYKLSAEIEGAEFWTPLNPNIRSLIAP